MKRLTIGLLVMVLAVLLAGCTDSKPSGPAPTRATTPAAIQPPEPTPTFMPTPSPTVEVVALVPTATPPVVPPTRFPTATPRPGQVIPDVGPSLTTFRATKASFQTAYGKAVARMGGVNGAARLVLAQSTTFMLDRTIWTFFFTVPQGNRSWSVTYDSSAGKDKKETVTVLDSSPPLLPEEAGQWQPNKLLDSDDITTRLLQSGLPPELPIDTVYVQLITAPQKGRLPAYVFVNGALGKQVIINAQTGAILQNDFI